MSNPNNATPADYLIITHSSLYASPSLYNLALRRSNVNGYDVAIVQVGANGPNNDIYDYFSGTHYQAIRDFISRVKIYSKANHTGDGHLGYFVLVGDALQDDNANEMVPASMFYSDIDEKGSDYYYACTGGDGDNVLDLIYGRIPVGNESQLNSAVNKIIQYETNYWGHWNNRTMFISCSPTLFVTADPCMKVMTEIIPPSCWRSYAWRGYTYNWSQVTEVNQTLPLTYSPEDYDDSGNLCGANLIEDWIYNRYNGINGGIHTFIYEGHAGWDALCANEGSGRLIFKLSDGNNNTIYNRLTNTFYTFMIINGCDAGHFDYNVGDCLAEVLVYMNGKGAIGCIAAARGSTDASFGKIDKKVIESMYNSLSHIMGEAVMESKINMENTWRRRFNLYGDPAVNLFPTGYTISENLTLTGNNTISEDITVASGVILTVAAGANLTFTNNTKLIINGTLTANGTSNNLITFNFVEPCSTSQNGIKFNSGSSG